MKDEKSRLGSSKIECSLSDLQSKAEWLHLLNTSQEHPWG